MSNFPPPPPLPPLPTPCPMPLSLNVDVGAFDPDWSDFPPGGMHASPDFRAAMAPPPPPLVPFAPPTTYIQVSPEELAPPVVILNDDKPRINVRGKGQRGEREVVKILQEIVDKVRERYRLEPLILQRNVLQAHLGGCDLHGLEGFAVEVKFVETEAVNQWWRQAVRQADVLTKTNRIPHTPILFYRASRQPWTVKFRAFVNTPGERDQIEMDLQCSLDDFLLWFEDAYDERLCELIQTFK